MDMINMKKFLCLCLTVSMIVCCFGFLGCKNDGIEYTAKNPVFRYESEVYEYGNGTGEQVRLTLKGCTPVQNFKFYKDFSKYYVDNLKGSGMYLLSRDNEIPPLNPYHAGDFGFYRENESNDLIIQESFDYYDKELGSKPNGGKDGVKAISVCFDVFIKSIKKIEIGEIVLEFGKLENKFYSYEKFINIYFGEECFATCYYDNHVTIPREWYENYFKTYLIYGDNL